MWVWVLCLPASFLPSFILPLPLYITIFRTGSRAVNWSTILFYNYIYWMLNWINIIQVLIVYLYNYHSIAIAWCYITVFTFSFQRKITKKRSLIKIIEDIMFSHRPLITCYLNHALSRALYCHLCQGPLNCKHVNSTIRSIFNVFNW